MTTLYFKHVTRSSKKLKYTVLLVHKNIDNFSIKLYYNKYMLNDINTTISFMLI